MVEKRFLFPRGDHIKRLLDGNIKKWHCQQKPLCKTTSQLDSKIENHKTKAIKLKSRGC